MSRRLESCQDWTEIKHSQIKMRGFNKGLRHKGVVKNSPGQQQQKTEVVEGHTKRHSRITKHKSKTGKTEYKREVEKLMPCLRAKNYINEVPRLASKILYNYYISSV